MLKFIAKPLSLLPGMVFLAVLTTNPVSGAIYKWVDNQGITQYSETPPLNRDYREMSIDSAPSDKTNAPVRSWKEQAENYQQRFGDSIAAEEKSKQTADLERRQQTENTRRCHLLKDKMDRLQAARPIYDLDAKGERAYLDDQQRAAMISATNKEIAEVCGKK